MRESFALQLAIHIQLESSGQKQNGPRRFSGYLSGRSPQIRACLLSIDRHPVFRTHAREQPQNALASREKAHRKKPKQNIKCYFVRLKTESIERLNSNLLDSDSVCCFSLSLSFLSCVWCVCMRLPKTNTIFTAQRSKYEKKERKIVSTTSFELSKQLFVFRDLRFVWCVCAEHFRMFCISILFA